MDDENLKTLVNILVSAAIVVVPLIAAYLARYIKITLAEMDKKVQAETTAEQYAFLVQLAELAVASAEQVIPGNDEKLNYAMRQLTRIAAQNNIPLTATDARMLVEGVLKGVKLGLEPIVLPEPVLMEGDAWTGGGSGASLQSDGPESN